MLFVEQTKRLRLAGRDVEASLLAYILVVSSQKRFVTKEYSKNF